MHFDLDSDVSDCSCDEHIHYTSIHNNEVLHLAIGTGNFELVKLLIQRRVSSTTADAHGVPPFFKIVDLSVDNEKYSNFLNFFLESRVYISTKWEQKDFTIIHYAAEKGNAKIIPLLVQKNCEINCKSKYGLTALHIAAKKGNTDVVKVLLSLNAQDMILNADNMTPLGLSIENVDLDVFNILLNHYTSSKEPKNSLSQRTDNKSLVSLAVTVGNIEMVKQLLLHGATINSFSTKTGQSALHTAVENGNIEMVELLLKHEPQLDRLNREGFTPFHLACAKGEFSIVSTLLSTNQFDVNDKSTTGLTALHLAVREGHSKIVTLLLEKGADYKAIDQNNKTPLSFVLENTQENTESFEILLTYIQQVQKDNSNDSSVLLDAKVFLEYNSRARKDETGNSALHLAVQEEDVAVVTLLAKYQAYILNKNGFTPFDLATVIGSLSIINVFLQSTNDRESLFAPKKENGYTPVHLAVETENTDMLELFFKTGISADISKPKSLTPLHIAVKKNNKNLTALLLKNGATVDVTGRTHLETPLFIATENGNIEILKLLLEASTARSSEWKEGYVLLYIAAFYGHEKIVKLLLDKRINPNSSVATYLTPLHAAAQRGHENIVHVLLENGAEINPKRKDNTNFISTPLLASSYARHSEIVNLLIEHGADINQRMGTFHKKFAAESEKVLTLGSYKESEIGKEGSLRGYTALHFAVEAGDEKIVKMLINRGAVLNSRSGNGATVIGLAIEKENIAIIELLLFSGNNSLDFHRKKPVLEMEILKKNLKLAEMIVKYVCSSQGHSYMDTYSVPLGIAVESGLENYVKVLLEAQADVRIYHKGEPLLHVAVKRKNCAIAEMLLKYGVDINLNTKDYGTALMAAVESDNEHAVQLLLDAGADSKLSKYDQSRSSNKYKHIKPLHVAVMKNNDTIVDIFLKKEGLNSYVGDLSPFRLALQKSNPEVVQIFLNHGASIDRIGKNGNFPLLHAVKGDNLKVIHFLLKKGASLTSVDIQGDTVLHVALKCSSSVNSERIIKLLLDYGIDVDIKNQKGCTPLSLILNHKLDDDITAISEIRSNLLKLFFANGADPNQTDDFSEKTMFELAMQRNNEEFITILLLNGINIDAVNIKNKTPLNVAIAEALKHSYGYQMSPEYIKYLDNSDHDNRYLYVAQFKKIAREVTKEVVRRQAVTDDLDERNRVSVESEYVKTYYDRCQEEIELMKVTEIFEGTFYFDLLTVNYTTLASLARNDNFKNILTIKSEVSQLFPEYAGVLCNRLKIGRERRLLLDSCHQLLRKIFRFDFALEIVENVYSFLSNRDLRNIKSSFDKDMFID